MPRLYNQKVTPSLQHYIDEDESKTSLCALFFVKKGFPFVSILDGGFVQAHSWLCREGPKRHLDAASVLVDYDETNSFFGRLEKSYKTQQELANATAREKTQHVLQNLIDSSMTTLTRTAQRVGDAVEDMEAEYSSESVQPKKLTNIVPTQEVEVEEEESFVGSPVSDSAAEDKQGDVEKESEGSFVSRFTGKLNKKSEKDDGPDENIDDSGTEKDQPIDGAEPKFKNPFAGFRKAEATPAGADAEAEGSEAGSANTPVFRNPFAARRSVVPEKGQADDKAGETGEANEAQVEDPDLVDVSIAPESSKPGTFSRLARAASSSIQKVGEQQASQNTLKRNPFARFGAKPAEKPAEGESKKPSNRFGGINMNQLRMNTLSNLRGKATGESSEAASEADLVEESISFDHDDTVAASPGESTAGDEKAKEPAGDAVVEAV